jgi:hypothetical protein
MQNLHQSTCDHEILCAGRSLKDEQLLIRPFLSKTKKYEHGRRLNVKIHSLFCETTHEPLHLDKLTLVEKEIIEIPISFI